MTEQNKKPYGTVLLKADQILEVLSQSGDPLTMNEIAKLTGITLSTTSKILDTLILLGYVRRDDTEKRYALGATILQLANAAFLHFDIVRESHPALKYLHEHFGETVHLGLFVEDQILYINKISNPNNKHQTLSRIGNTQPLYCSAMGKATLATFDKHVQNQYLDSVELVQRTPYTITDPAELLTQVKESEEKGYAIDDRESEEEVFCVGAAIVNPIDRNHYAFSISVPYYRLTEEMKKEMIAAVTKTKTIIEFQLESYAG